MKDLFLGGDDCLFFFPRDEEIMWLFCIRRPFIRNVWKLMFNSRTAASKSTARRWIQTQGVSFTLEFGGEDGIVLTYSWTQMLFQIQPLPRGSLTVWPWKYTIPKGEDRLPTIIFQGLCLTSGVCNFDFCSFDGQIFNHCHLMRSRSVAWLCSSKRNDQGGRWSGRWFVVVALAIYPQDPCMDCMVYLHLVDFHGKIW